jgi:hypothetical protein
VTSDNDADGVFPAELAKPMQTAEMMIQVREAVSAMSSGSFIPDATPEVQFAADIGVLRALADAYWDGLHRAHPKLLAAVAEEARARAAASVAAELAVRQRKEG